MPRVLLIEDDEISAAAVEEVLRDLGHKVAIAPDVRAAWRLLREALTDLIILDTHLGGDHGWDFLAELRRDPLLAQLPVIVYSGALDRATVQRYLRLGAKNILAKPYSAERLRRETEPHLQTRWHSVLHETREHLQARTALSLEKLADLCRELAAKVENFACELPGAASGPLTDAQAAVLDTLRGGGLSLGQHGLIRTLAELEAAAKDFDTARWQNARVGLGLLASLLRQQAHGFSPAPAAAPAAPEPRSNGRAFTAPPPVSNPDPAANNEAPAQAQSAPTAASPASEPASIEAEAKSS